MKDNDQHRAKKQSPDAAEDFENLRERLKTESSDSRKLLENVSENPVCSVTVDKAVPCIFVCWKQYATSTQLRFIHESILKLVKEHGLSKILGDDTDLPTIHSEDRSWIAENWMPRAIQAGLRFGAAKRPDAYFGELSVSNLRSMAPNGLLIRAFDNLAEAKRWLSHV